MAKKSDSALEKKLTLKTESAWNDADKKTVKAIQDFGEGYKEFLRVGKTEREVVDLTVKIIEKKGFKSIDKYKKLKAGDKVYMVNKGRVMAMAVIGKKGLDDGFRMIASHVDSPRIDLKQKPLYEDSDIELALFKTHYYGGIKKYQWVNIPLAIHGVVVKADGKKVNIVIGEDESDPVFVIGDLLPHLAHKTQGTRTLFEGIKGEELVILAGHQPLSSEKDAKNKIKLHILKLLNDKYGITEEDLISAELEAVPAMNPRDVGLDRSMIGAYGQDDRACAYTSLMALLDIEKPEMTNIAYFFDKEEVGSIGATGAQSNYLELSVSQIMAKLDPDFKYFHLKTIISKSIALSADVDVAVHPVFKEVHELNNAARIGHGIVICKFGGARGKGGANDATAEYMGQVRTIFNKNKIPWQSAELGRVDEGGGGTVARFLAENNIDVVDCGPALLSMHSPYEISSKADIYHTYRAYRSFFSEKDI
ncbi:MAG: aminopeptidase [Thermoplasmata archaeon]|nr:aminopeptidase [Thermoplasmata archaeon]